MREREDKIGSGRLLNNRGAHAKPGRKGAARSFHDARQLMSREMITRQFAASFFVCADNY